jgi:anti-sigma B factor antagonist
MNRVLEEKPAGVTQSFQVASSDIGDVRVMAIEGYLDAHTAPVFESSIENEIRSGRIRVVVDCARLTYISSAGLGVFMSFLEEVREQGGDIKLAAITPKVYQVFDVLGFPKLFDITSTVEAAVERFSPARGQ